MAVVRASMAARAWGGESLSEESVFSSSCRRIASAFSLSATIVGVTLKVSIHFQKDSTSSATIASALIASFSRSFFVVFDYFFQVVDVVKKDIVYVVKAGIKVTRHPEVNKEHGSPLALVQRLQYSCRPQKVVTTSHRTNHHVSKLEVLGKALKGNCSTTELTGQLCSAFQTCG